MVSGIDIRRVLRTGRRSRRRLLDVHWTPGEADGSRFGVVVARGGHTAVERNRLRRRLKELWRRELASALPPGPLDVIIRTHRDAYDAPFGALRRELLSWASGVAQ